MQLLLWCTLIDWFGIFCMARVICSGGMVPWNQCCGSSSVSGIRRKISCIVHKGECIVRKGEKQIQILDGY
jgi:hypothetical protein